jgi:hypothetical protein
MELCWQHLLATVPLSQLVIPLARNISLQKLNVLHKGLPLDPNTGNKFKTHMWHKNTRHCYDTDCTIYISNRTQNEPGLSTELKTQFLGLCSSTTTEKLKHQHSNKLKE